MSDKKRYRDLMEKIYHSHQEFTEVWNRVRSAELRKHDIDDNDFRMSGSYERIWDANGVAYDAARPQSDKRDEFLSVLFNELPFEMFLQGKPEAIDSILDFLEIDVLAFRCGYTKQWCFRKLKSLPLNQKQIARLCQLLLNMCDYSGQREEMKELIRLTIRFADEILVQDLQRVARIGRNKYVRQKAERALKVILNSRHDLK